MHEIHKNSSLILQMPHVYVFLKYSLPEIYISAFSDSAALNYDGNNGPNVCQW